MLNIGRSVRCVLKFIAGKLKCPGLGSGQSIMLGKKEEATSIAKVERTRTILHSSSPLLLYRDVICIHRNYAYTLLPPQNPKTHRARRSPPQPYSSTIIVQTGAVRENWW